MKRSNFILMKIGKKVTIRGSMAPSRAGKIMLCEHTQKYFSREKRMAFDQKP